MTRLRLAGEANRYAGDCVSMFAGLIIVLLPTVVVFLTLQRQIMGGMTIGALKG